MKHAPASLARNIAAKGLSLTRILSINTSRMVGEIYVKHEQYEDIKRKRRTRAVRAMHTQVGVYTTRIHPRSFLLSVLLYAGLTLGSQLPSTSRRRDEPRQERVEVVAPVVGTVVLELYAGSVLRTVRANSTTSEAMRISA